MAYIGFLFIMIGLAATGGALDGKGDIVCAVDAAFQRGG